MANFFLNHVEIAGRLTADPELKTTASGVSVTNFTVAVRTGKDVNGEAITEFLSVVAWRNTAEMITRYFRKGSSIFIEGRLQTRKWTANDGSPRSVTEIVANSFLFVDSRSEVPAGEMKLDNSNPRTGDSSTTYIPDAYKTPASAPKFEDLEDNEDLPF